MEEFHKGDFIWFDPGFGYSVPGEVIEFHRAGQVITIQSVIDGKAQVFTMNSITSVRRRHDLGPYGIEDMIQLGDLNEASLLWNLRIRYDKQLIYTYIGSILIAVNPYKMFDIYGLNIVKKYEEHSFGALPPHLFSIGSAAYFRMSKDRENQVVVISGESGAGKTESTKLIMQYLAAVNKSSSNLITEQILEASPLLESFGNAKTSRNDNSSRFGKYLEVHFKSGVIIGAKTTEYLLEKSRIVTQAPDERNYHVFYEMLAGLDRQRREEYGLMAPDKYFYLNQGGNCEIPCKDDAEDFLALLSAMQVLGFTSDEQEVIFKILAAVLHLGNIYFNKKQLKHGQEGVEIGKDVEVKWAAHLLQLSVEGIVSALTTKTTEARNERLLTPLNFDQALDARDAIAKALYSSLFSWLVQRINNIICKGQKNTSIAILDIFGFEDFKENSFEQLCINYANETLQYYFNKHIFKLEQQEYAKEKIDWQVITFQDNQPVINLISKKPVGIFHLLDDESNFPKATDLSFLEKCHYNHALNELYSRPRMSSMEFGIKHYAGQVWYSVDSFLDKNRDTLRSDVVELLISSRVPLISKMFSDLKNNAEVNKTMNRSNGRFVTMKPRTPTVAARFHDSLSALVENMTRCNPWFVRCIKPNNEKAPMNFDMCVVLEQLQYTGMLETIKIRKMGYPIRLRFSAFAERYKCLRSERVPKGVPAREVCRVIIDKFARRRDEYQLGTSKIFLREHVEQVLEQERNKILNSAAIIIQKHLRARFARKRYLTLRRNAVRFQARIRGFLVRQEFKKKREAAIKIQAYMRMMKQKQQYQKLKEEEKLKKLADKEAKERAKIKAQKMELERAAQATAAGINHLEIPAELAFIFSKLDDWKPPYTDRNITKVVGQILPLEENYQLPLDLDYHPFSKFVNVYFKTQVWGAKQQPLKAPLLSKLKENDYHESLAVFKLILRFMKDNNLVGRREILLGNYIVQKGLRNESLRDEILCQLCNQTWKNEKENSSERGWLLIANCLSCFPPSKTLYKYLLKYVSDHGYGDLATICQKKLLQSEKVDFYSIRNYPPCMLEWRANRKHFGMALPVNFYDDETVYGPVESWTTGEEFAANVVKSRGISDNWGWSLNMVNFNIKKELNGYDYVLDLITEEELPPAFPVCKSPFLFSGDQMPRKPAVPTRSDVEAVDPYAFENSGHSRNKRSMQRSRSQEVLQEDNHSELLRSKVKSQSHEWLMQDDVEMGLSRYSALNERYFEKNSEETYPNVNDFGLSHSKLNQRYHSIENLPDSSKKSNQNYHADVEFSRLEKKTDSRLQKLEVQIPDINDAKEGSDLKWGLSSSALNDRYFHHADKESKYEMDRDGTTISHDNFSEGNINMNGHSDVENAMSEDVTHSNGLIDFPEFDFHDANNDGDFDLTKPNQSGSRFVKQNKKSQSSTYSHSTKGYLETKDFAPRSSALSDTSEAPSLASHVKQVRVPSHTSDLDQYLDDLFNPVLDGNLDELSDARSLAASIKGGHYQCNENDDKNSETSTPCGTHVDQFIKDILDPVIVNRSVNSMNDIHILSKNLKGGGKGFGQMDNQGASTSSVPMMNMMLGGIQSPLPGMMSPPPMMGTNGLMNSFSMIPSINPTVPMYSIGGHHNDNPSGSTPLMFAYVPLYNASGLNLPMWNGTAGVMDPSQLALQQQLLQQQQQQAMQVNASQMQQMQQRAFVASAYQQNLQIQQQLIQQNRALQQLLQQGGESPTDSTKTNSGSAHTSVHSKEIHSPVQEKSFKKSRGVEFSDSDQIVWNEERSRHWGVSSMSPPPLPPKSASTPNHSHSKLPEKSPPSKYSPIRHAENDSFIPNGHRSQNDFPMDKPSPVKSKFIPTGNIPPPPPLPPEPPDGDRPFTNVYGRAKTVRIGKWRWPPPRTEDNAEDSFFEFKMRSSSKRPEDERQLSSSSDEIDHSAESKEWRSYSQNNQDQSRQSFMLHGRNQGMETESPDTRPAGSIGKLKISSEMKAKLEALTLNHSVRSSSNKNDARRVYAAVHKLKAQAKDGNIPGVQKLEEDRKLALQRKLGGYDYRSRNESMHTRNDTLEKESRNHAPPPPVAPPSFNIPPPPPSTSSFYDHTETAMMKTKSPPPPVSPTSGMYQHQHNHHHHHHHQSQFEEKMEHVSEMEKFSSSYVSKHKEIEPFERKKSKFYGTNKLLYITYTRTPWKLYVRKEIFYPGEQLSNPLVLHLLFCQIVLDVHLLLTVRLNPDEAKKLKQLLDGYGITPSNLHSTHHKSTVKKNIIDVTRDFPVYFSRLFSVSGGRHDTDVEMVGISHSGIKLIKRQRQVPNDWLRVLQEYSFDDVVSVSIPRSSTVQIILRNGRHLIFYTHKAGHIKKLVDKFLFESEGGAITYVRAIADYITRESTLLSFHEGDVIRVVNRNPYEDKGWLNGSLHGRTGIFPSEYVVPLGRHNGFGKKMAIAQEINTNNYSSKVVSSESRSKQYTEHSARTERSAEQPNWTEPERPAQFTSNEKMSEDIFTSSGTQANDGKHSLLQFALLNFRESLNKYEMLRKADGSIRGSLKMIESLKSKKKGKKGKDSDWTWKEQVELVKYTKSPIQASLLKLETSELNKLALESFLAIMKYMGDYPLNKNQTDVDCVYSLLMACHHNHNLRDEVYCQIMKQTTNNKSPKPDSCQKGWRLFSILAAYFDCSDVLKPYLFKYLETAAYDKRRAYHGTAMVCLQNLRKTFKYGGRKNVPSIEEITAITAGRNSKRQIYRLPGGTERIINTKSTSVVADIIEEICGQLNIRISQEMEEFSLYCIVEGDSYTMPLAREEYILDVTTELHKNHQVFYLIFCRSVWWYPLRLDSQLYIEVVFNQTAPDYLEGLLIISHEERISTDLAPEIAKLAALLHRAQQMDSPPTIKETKYLLPKPALSIRDIKPPEWVEMVQNFWMDIEIISPTEAKAQFLELLQKWPLFGSSFFAVKRHGDGADLILAVNSHGVHFFDGVNHESVSQYPFSEIISTRKVKTEDGALLLDMKIGNLMQQKINRIQTEQAHEISQLIKRYIMIEQKNKGMQRNQSESSRDGMHHNS